MPHCSVETSGIELKVSQGSVGAAPERQIPPSFHTRWQYLQFSLL